MSGLADEILEQLKTDWPEAYEAWMKERAELAAERERKDPIFLWAEIRKQNAARKAAEAERDELRALLREARIIVADEDKPRMDAGELVARIDRALNKGGAND